MLLDLVLQHWLPFEVQQLVDGVDVWIDLFEVLDLGPDGI